MCWCVSLDLKYLLKLLCHSSDLSVDCSVCVKIWGLGLLINAEGFPDGGDANEIVQITWEVCKVMSGPFVQRILWLTDLQQPET